MLYDVRAITGHQAVRQELADTRQAMAQVKPRSISQRIQQFAM
jgi:hypothetical protein